MATFYVSSAASGSDDGTSPTHTGGTTGPWTLSQAASGLADGDTLRIMADGTYTLTTTVTWSITGTTTNGGVLIEGANSSGTYDGTRPTITSATSSVHLFTLAGSAYIKFRTLKFTHTGATRGSAFIGVTTGSTNITIEDVVIDGCLNGVDGSSRQCCNAIRNSTIKNCTNIGLNYPSSAVEVEGTLIDSCSSDGYSSAANTATPSFAHCTIVRNGGHGIHDSGTSRAVTITVNSCTISKNTGDGIRSDESTGTLNLYGQGNILWGNGGYNVNCPSLTTNKSKAGSSWDYAFLGGATSGNYNNFPSGVNDVALTVDPATNSATGDFSLNNTAGGGAACRAASFPGTYPEASWSGHLDGGAVQHPDAGGGGGIANIAKVVQNIGTY